MKYDDLLKPISPDAPCGEDLLAADDDEFIDYYFNVEDRLPTAYFNIVRNTLFDPKTVDFKAESAQIDGLLKKTRDIRLLVLEAKFQILATRFKPFCDAVLAIAGLLEAYPDDLHPQVRDGSPDRRNAIEELNSLHTVATPLDYAPLMNDRRYGDVIFRPYGIATGTVTAREDEGNGDSASILTALSHSDNTKAVDALYALVCDVLGAIDRINAVCRTGSNPFTPTLPRFIDKMTEIKKMILAARTDLAPAEETDGTPDEGAVTPGAEGEAEDGAPAKGMTITLPSTPGVPDHRAAYHLLSSAERYFATREPASLALTLVTQARLLIGRPLVESMDALVEDSVNRAVIDLGGDAGFTISISRMRRLADEANIPQVDQWRDEPPEEPLPEILSREHAGQTLKAIEDFFKTREPASPIPILLGKARALLGKDFQSLMREIIPPSPY